MKPLQLGNVTIDHPVILAPMAGVTDIPFRVLCREMGAGMVCMEMVSAKAISYHNKNTERLLEIRESEHPVSLQLFGSEPELVGEVARSIDDRPFDILDFNMGCPVPKVVNNGEGSALMKDPELAGRIMKELVKGSSKPVTVKIRKGWDADHVNAVELAKRAEDAGVSAVAVHGRTRSQYYAGEADWDIIRQVKEAVRIPVIGNGDITSPRKARQMLEETGCDGIMIARGAEGNPWIFRQVVHFLETGEELPAPTKHEKGAVARRHAQLLLEVKGDYIGVREMRKHLAWYTAGMPGASKARGRLGAIETPEEILQTIEELFGA
ncbi:MAG: tRNA dihydrouridine synthase DusB [Lachnospiraceae bacterium]|nr:tRNA dihydrouridine synthase DusB [Lachnospiraceae bacterium]